jgi:hypothetical protein
MRIFICARLRNLCCGVCLHRAESASPGGGKIKASKWQRAGGGERKVAAKDGGFMGSITKWMLGAAMVAGTLGLSAAPAQAARIGVYVGARAYVPPSPGPGYAWVDGYYSNGYWVPGYWNFVGVRVGGPAFRGGVVFDRGRDFYRGRDFDRHFGRGDHFRR